MTDITPGIVRIMTHEQMARLIVVLETPYPGLPEAPIIEGNPDTLYQKENHMLKEPRDILPDPAMPHAPGWVTLAYAARVTGIQRKTLARLARQNRVVARKVGRAWHLRITTPRGSKVPGLDRVVKRRPGNPNFSTKRQDMGTASLPR